MFLRFFPTTTAVPDLKAIFPGGQTGYAFGVTMIRSLQIGHVKGLDDVLVRKLASSRRC